MIQDIKGFLGNSWPYLCALFILIYFVYHLIGGKHGLISWQHLDNELAQAKKTLAHLKQEEASFDQQIRHLKSPINQDLLEEQVGGRLNLHQSDDRILLPHLSQDFKK